MHELELLDELAELVTSAYFAARDAVESDDPVGLITDILNAVHRDSFF